MNDSKTVVGKVEAVSKSVKTESAVANARTSASLSSPEELHQTIAVVAYYRAERRNFEPGYEVED
jgi:2-methylisocitrate lyase-like PEP mutase family enzyme